MNNSVGKKIWEQSVAPHCYRIPGGKRVKIWQGRNQEEAGITKRGVPGEIQENRERRDFQEMILFKL